jgi:hypothetical protein
MSANPNVPVLFYSERCNNSKEVVQTIQALNKASLFRFVCIDTTPRQYIPQEIKAVPAVMMPTKEVITGKTAIFARISKPVESRRELPQGRAAAPAQPQEWSFNEAKSISSGFSSFDGNSIGDDQLRYTFLEGITTSGQGSEDGDIAARMKMMEAQRSAEFKGR